MASALGAYGIYSSIAPLHHAANDWLKLVALGGLEVRVLDAELQEAREILLDVELQSEGFLSESAAIRQRPLFYALVFFLFYAYGILFPMWLRHRYREVEPKTAE